MVCFISLSWISSRSGVIENWHNGDYMSRSETGQLAFLLFTILYSAQMYGVSAAYKKTVDLMKYSFWLAKPSEITCNFESIPKIQSEYSTHLTFFCKRRLETGESFVGTLLLRLDRNESCSLDTSSKSCKPIWLLSVEL